MYGIETQVSFDVGEPPVQTHIDSMIQVELQPSESMLFPSSHCSGGTLRPSPQTLVHCRGIPDEPPVQW